jgi:hypothetical protein
MKEALSTSGILPFNKSKQYPTSHDQNISLVLSFNGVGADHPNSVQYPTFGSQVLFLLFKTALLNDTFPKCGEQKFKCTSGF